MGMLEIKAFSLYLLPNERVSGIFNLINRESGVEADEKGGVKFANAVPRPVAKEPFLSEISILTASPAVQAARGFLYSITATESPGL